jgi:phage-related protein
MTASNNTPDPYSLIYSDPTNYFAGVNLYNFTDNTAPQFTYDPIAFSLTSTGYLNINISTLNYRYRNCATPTIYYV